MTTNEILEKIDLATEMLFSNDKNLLERRLNERAIANKLAQYLQPLFIGYNVDSEYNGDLDKPNDKKALSIASNKIREIGLRTNDKQIYKIIPDIIIHSRGNNNRNLVVIEVKKDISASKLKEYDLLKLEHLTIDYLGNHYNYKLGVAITLNTGDKSGTKTEIYFQNGILESDRNRLRD